MGPIKKPQYKGVEQKAGFYGARISTDLSLNVFWRRLYDEAIKLLPPDIDVPIIDLGCGPGYFAKVLYSKGYKNYCGVDFAKACIEVARKNVPEFKFMIGNLYSKRIQEEFEKYSVFILLETLEHLERDTIVLKAIPKGRQIILSVPSAGGISHVRRFKTARAVRLRYNAFIEFKAFSCLSLGPAQKKFWLSCGKKL